MLLLLKCQGFSSDALEIVFNVLVVSKVRFALPACTGQLSAADKSTGHLNIATSHNNNSKMHGIQEFSEHFNKHLSLHALLLHILHTTYFILHSVSNRWAHSLPLSPHCLHALLHTTYYFILHSVSNRWAHRLALSPHCLHALLHTTYYFILHSVSNRWAHRLALSPHCLLALLHTTYYFILHSVSNRWAHSLALSPHCLHALLHILHTTSYCTPCPIDEHTVLHFHLTVFMHYYYI